MQTEETKPIIVFTNFWDANSLIKNRFFLVEHEDKILKINLNKKNENQSNFMVYSIALSHPPLDNLAYLDTNPHHNMKRLDFFCPTYDLLYKYKKDKDWSYYVDAYKNILKKRKDRVLTWVDSLANNTIYILCCWENTSLKSKCHRELIYDAFKSSKYTKDKLLTFYRHGNESKNKKTSSSGNEIYSDNPFDNIFVNNVNNDVFNDFVDTMLPLAPSNSDFNPRIR